MRFNDDEHLEGPDEADADLLDEEDDSADEVACPSCGAPMHEDSPRCPACGEWVTAGTEAERRMSGWVWPVLIVALILGLILILS